MDTCYNLQRERERERERSINTHSMTLIDRAQLSRPAGSGRRARTGCRPRRQPGRLGSRRVPNTGQLPNMGLTKLYDPLSLGPPFPSLEQRLSYHPPVRTQRRCNPAVSDSETLGRLANGLPVCHPMLLLISRLPTLCTNSGPGKDSLTPFE